MKYLITSLFALRGFAIVGRAVAADPAWLEIPLRHATDDAEVRVVELAASSLCLSSSPTAVDAGAYCERVTVGGDLDSRPCGTILMFR